MALDIGDAVRTGVNRTIARNGLLFVAVFFVLGAVNVLTTASMMRGFIPQQGFGGMGPTGPMGQMGPAAGPSLGLSPAVAGLVGLIVGIASVFVTIAAIRTFVSDETEAIPEEHFTHNALWAFLNVVVGGIVFGIIVAIGLILLIIPGLFLLVSLFFWNVFVVVEDRNFIDGFRESWSLTDGHRLRLFLLGVVVVVVTVVVGAIFGIPAVIGGYVGMIVTQVGSALTTVFSVATVAAAYNQLTAGEAVGEVAMDEPAAGEGDVTEE